MSQSAIQYDEPILTPEEIVDKYKGLFAHYGRRKIRTTEELDSLKPLFTPIYIATCGNLTETCQRLAIHHTAYYKWCAEDPDFKAECEIADEINLDKSEAALYHLAHKERNIRAIQYHLSHKGKHRGYGSDPSSQQREMLFLDSDAEIIEKHIEREVEKRLATMEAERKAAELQDVTPETPETQTSLQF